MKKNEYMCTACEKIFVKDCTDEEALQELKYIHGDIDLNKCSIVCDDCYKKVMTEISN